MRGQVSGAAQREHRLAGPGPAHHQHRMVVTGPGQPVLRRMREHAPLGRRQQPVQLRLVGGERGPARAAQQRLVEVLGVDRLLGVLVEGAAAVKLPPRLGQRAAPGQHRQRNVLGGRQQRLERGHVRLGGDEPDQRQRVHVDAEGQQVAVADRVEQPRDARRPA
ncbi:hypothetical protein ACFSTC_05395 [Nonomuraea ferruginea]